MKDFPLVTIGVPSYNNAAYVIKTLNSAIDQTYNNIELIIIDDCSTDNSYQIIENWREENNVNIQMFRNETNLGISKTMNLLLKYATGKYFQKLDADDILLNDKIEKQVSILENSGTDVALAYADILLMDERDDLIEECYLKRIGSTGKVGDDVFLSLLNKNHIPCTSVLLKTTILKNEGGFNENLDLYEDWDLWLRLSLKYHFKYIHEPLSYYRIHKDSQMLDEQKKILRNKNNLVLMSSFFEQEKKYKKIIFKKIEMASIYAFVLKDTNASTYLQWCLRRRFNLKVIVYFVLSKIRIKHPANWFVNHG